MRENLPVYFIASDTASSGCRVLNSPGSPHITSNPLEFPDGQSIDFLNAQSGVTCTPEQTENRLMFSPGRTLQNWHSHLPLSRRVRFRSIYPGVDLVYYGSGSDLEYDFEVAPQADASRIRSASAKSRTEALAPGRSARNGERFHVDPSPPSCLSGRSRDCCGLRNRPKQHTGADQLGKYDRSRRLIIDPVLAWQASFNRGGSSVNSVAVDPGGNMWLLSIFRDRKRDSRVPSAL